MEKVTAVLLNFKRSRNIPLIIDSLRRYSIIDEIVVWNNGEPSLRFESPLGVSVITEESQQNVCTYGRFLAAERSKNRIIYTQDDDYIVKNVEFLYEQFLSIKCTKVTAGLAEDQTCRHYTNEAHQTPWIQLGWGAFFMKEWVRKLDRYIEQYGEDELLFRKADRVFTTLMGKHNPQIAAFQRLQDSSGRFCDRDENSLWLRNDHSALTKEAVARALRLRSKTWVNTGS